MAARRGFLYSAVAMPTIGLPLIARRTLALLAAAFGGLAAHAAPAPDLVALTEEWAPYNYSEQGEVKGIATDVLRAACALAQLRCEFRVVPWARALALATAQPNTLAYTTARKPERERAFLWIGPLLPRATWVYGRAGSESSLRRAQDLALHRFGVVRGEAAAQDLQAAGVPAASLVPDNSNAAVLRMLLGGWVDAMVDTEIGMAWNLRNANAAPSEVVRLMKLSDEGGYYYALNPRSDAVLARKLQAALDKLRASGAIERSIAAYLRPKAELAAAP